MPMLKRALALIIILSPVGCQDEYTNVLPPPTVVDGDECPPPEGLLLDPDLCMVVHESKHKIVIECDPKALKDENND